MPPTPPSADPGTPKTEDFAGECVASTIPTSKCLPPPPNNAVPKAWPTGSVKGLRAKGGFQVDIAWRDGKLLSATLTSKLGKPCKIRCADKVLEFPTQPGQQYLFDGQKIAAQAK